MTEWSPFGASCSIAAHSTSPRSAASIWWYRSRSSGSFPASSRAMSSISCTSGESSGSGTGSDALSAISRRACRWNTYPDAAACAKWYASWLMVWMIDRSASVAFPSDHRPAKSTSSARLMFSSITPESGSNIPS